MMFLPTGAPGDDESGVLEEAEMLHDAEAGHRHVGLELGQRPPLALEERIQQESTGRVGQGPEDEVVIVHATNIRDYLVTCLPTGTPPKPSGRPGQQAAGDATTTIRRAWTIQAHWSRGTRLSPAAGD